MIRLSSYLSMLLLCFALLGALSLPAQQFIQVTGGAGILNGYGTGAYGGGISFCDFDNDGWDDLTLASQQGDSIHFFRNIGGSFEKLASLIPNTSEVKQVLWVDYDNDGDKDLYLTSNQGANRLYENTGDLNLLDKTSGAGLPLDSMPTFGAAWGDYDNDGYLDLYFTNRTGSIPYSNYLYRNLGNGTFADVTNAAGVADSNKRAFCAAFVDVDHDRWPDIYVAQDYQFGNTLFRNLGTGSFGDISLSSNANLTMDAMCVTAGDYDNDNDLDIYVTNTQLGNRMLRNNNNGTFTEVGTAIGVALNHIGWGSTFFDMENDGDLDLFVCAESSGPNYVTSHHLYENLGNGNFAYSTNAGFGTDVSANFSSATGDFNRDGFPDIAVLNNFSQDLIRLWENQGTGANWLRVKLQGTNVNRDGVGSFIEVYCGGTRYMRYTQCGTGFLSQNSSYEHFGVGNFSMIDSVKVLWPDGTEDLFIEVCPNRQVTLIQGTSNPQGTFNISSLGNLSACGDSVSLTAGNHFSYQWSTGDTSSSITVYNGGNFQVTVSDTNGLCAVSPSLPLPVLSTLTVSTSVSQSISCYGGSTGALSATANGGLPPYTYAWRGGQSGASATGLGSGIYGLTLTDANGCIAQSTISLYDPQPLIANALIHEVSCNGLSDGEVTAFGYGGATPYSYQWATSPSTGNSLNNLSSGVYPLTISDNLGCSRLDTVTISEPAPLTLGFAASDISCFGLIDGQVGALAGGGTLPYTYLWSNNNSQQSIDSLMAGIYRLTLSDENNCQVIDSALVQEPLPIVSSTTVSHASCFGKNNGSALAQASGGTGTLLYQWLSGPNGPSNSGIGAGSYPLEITDVNGCLHTDTAEITQPAFMALTITGDSVSCNGAADARVDLNVTGGTPNYTYTWNNGPDTNALINLNGGSYSVTVSDQNGCIGFQTINVFEPTQLSTSSQLGHLTCNGDTNGSINLNILGGIAPYSVNWNNGTHSGTQLTGLLAGAYDFEINDSLNCVRIGSLTLIEPPFLGLTGTNKPQSFGLNGQAIALATGGNPPYSYLWDDPNQQTSDTADHLAAGSYSVTVTDSDGCMNTYSVQVPFVTGISNQTEAFAWNLYPNPATNQLFVHLETTASSSNMRIELINALGQQVGNWPMDVDQFSATETISLAAFSSGVYLCQLRSETQILGRKKVVIEH